MLQPLCERCQNYPARVSITRTFLGGQRTTKLLCADCARQRTTEAMNLMPDACTVNELTHDERLSSLDDHIVNAPFEALMAACFASDEGFMDDIFDEDDDPFGDDEPLSDPFDDESNPLISEVNAVEEDHINLFQHIEAIGDEGEAECSNCGAHWEQIVLDERAGCPKCYSVFRASLTALLEQVQRESQHVGKMPRAAQKRRLRLEHLRQRRDNQLQLLRNRLAEAVNSERYEEAATLRDRIKVVSSSLF